MMIEGSDALGGYMIGSAFRDRRKERRSLKTSHRSIKAAETDTFTPPADVANAARQALEARAKQSPSNRGMTPVGLARARQLSNRDPVSLSTIRRMASYFARHEVDKKGSTWSDKGKGWQAWQGWGGDAGRDWAESIIRKVDQGK